MTRLSALNLPSNTARYHYDRSAVTAGIVKSRADAMGYYRRISTLIRYEGRLSAARLSL